MYVDPNVMEGKGVEVEDEGNGKQHPLEMAEIVETLLDFVPVKDVETFRLVSSVWNKEASKHLRKRQTVVLKYPGTVQAYLDTLDPSDPDFRHALFQISSLYSFRRELERTQFWSICGQHIKTLELIEEELSWQDLGEVLLKKVPQLETLSLVHLPWNFAEEDTPVVDTKLYQNESVKTLRLRSLDFNHMLTDSQLVDILKALPNLQVIDIIEKKPDDSEVLINVLSQDVSLPCLRSVGTHLRLNNERLRILANARSSLRKLHITLEDRVTASSFESLMSLVRPTLLELKITFPDYYSENPEKLEEHPEAFICLLTNLRTLHLTNFKWPKEFVTKLSTCFPNLRCLHVHDVDDERLRMIYKGLPLLSELELTNAHCTDWGLTGISLEVCNDMLETCSPYDRAGKHRTDLYIGSLPYLQKLTVIGSLFTNISVALGLAECRNLKELKIGSNLILNQGIIFLVDRLRKQLDLLDVSECTELTDDTKVYAQVMIIGTVKAEAEAEVAVEEKKDCRRERVVVKRPVGIVPPNIRE